MGRKLQIKRGVEADLPTLSSGELALTTDKKELYYGTGAENIPVAKKSHTHTAAAVGAAPDIHTHTTQNVNGLDAALQGKLNGPVAIPSNADLNSYITPGLYAYGEGMAVVNTPIPAASFSLFVEYTCAHGKGSKQTFTEYSTGATYIRTNFIDPNGTWSPWTKLVTDLPITPFVKLGSKAYSTTASIRIQSATALLAPYVDASAYDVLVVTLSGTLICCIGKRADGNYEGSSIFAGTDYPTNSAALVSFSGAQNMVAAKTYQLNSKTVLFRQLTHVSSVFEGNVMKNMFGPYFNLNYDSYDVVGVAGDAVSGLGVVSGRGIDIGPGTNLVHTIYGAKFIL